MLELLLQFGISPMLQAPVSCVAVSAWAEHSAALLFLPVEGAMMHALSKNGLLLACCTKIDTRAVHCTFARTLTLSLLTHSHPPPSS